MQRQGLAPSAGTYSALIGACEKGERPRRALELFQATRGRGYLPDVITYNALVRACEKGGQPDQLEQALELFAPVIFQSKQLIH